MNHRISDIARLRLGLAFFFFLIEKNQQIRLFSAFFKNMIFC